MEDSKMTLLPTHHHSGKSPTRPRANRSSLTPTSRVDLPNIHYNPDLMTHMLSAPPPTGHQISPKPLSLLERISSSPSTDPRIRAAAFSSSRHSPQPGSSSRPQAHKRVEMGAELAELRQANARLKTDEQVLTASAEEAETKLRVLEFKHQALESKLRAEVKAKDAAKATIVRVRLEHGRGLETLVNQHRSKVDELEEVFEVQMGALRAELRSESEEVRRFFACKIAKMRHQHAEESDCARLCHDQALAALRRDFEVESEGMKREAEAREVRTRLEHSTKTSQIRSELDQARSIASTETTRRVQSSTDLEELKGSLQLVRAELFAAREELQATQTELLRTKTTHEREITAMQEEMTRLREVNQFDALGQSQPTPLGSESSSPVICFPRLPEDIWSPVSLDQEIDSLAEQNCAKTSSACPLFLPDDQSGSGNQNCQMDRADQPDIKSSSDSPAIVFAPLRATLDDLFTPPSASVPTFASSRLPSVTPAATSASALSSPSSHRGHAVRTIKINLKVDQAKESASRHSRRLSLRRDAECKPQFDSPAAEPSMTPSTSSMSSAGSYQDGIANRKSALSTPAHSYMSRRSSTSRIASKPIAPHDGMFEVEAIVGELQRKMPDGSLRTAYKVHWKGFPLDQESFIWADEIENDEGWDRMYAHFLARDSGVAKRQRFKVAK